MACLAVFRADKHHDEELYSEHKVTRQQRCLVDL